MGFQSETLGLERNGAAAGKRVEDRRGIAVGRLHDFRFRFREKPLVVDVLPDDQSLDDLVQAFPLDLLGFLCGELLGM